jgi:hypothetical protein
MDLFDQETIPIAIAISSVTDQTAELWWLAL